jgi:hypothetical protein
MTVALEFSKCLLHLKPKDEYTMAERSKRSSLVRKARNYLTIIIALLTISQLLFHAKVGDLAAAVAVAQLNEHPVEAASPVEAANSTLTGKRQFAKYAYAFVLGGCKPEDKFPAYRYFVYNILVSARVLREAGSQADVVAFFQISYNSTFDRLPSEDVRLLEAMNIRIIYIPKSAQESFYRTGKNISCRLDG